MFPALEPITAGASTTNPANPSDPCRPQSSGLSDFHGPAGCVLNLLDPNCNKPAVTSVGLLYATTEECRGLTADPGQPTDCGVKNLQTDPATGDGVRSRAGVADIFLTGGGMFLHVSAANAFATVRCDGATPVFDARSQVAFVNLNNQLGLDLIPGLIPNGDPTHNLNTHARLDGGALGTIDFNETLVDGVRQPGPTPTIPAGTHRITQRAIDIESPLGSLIVGEATVDVTGNACNAVAQVGHIKIIKDTVPDDPQDFTFDGTAPIGTFMLDDDGGTDGTLQNNKTFDLSPGHYTVTERQLAEDDANDDHSDGHGDDDGDDADDAGFTLTNVACSTGGTGSTETRTATIDLLAGQLVTCTFTNTKRDDACQENGDDNHDNSGPGNNEGDDNHDNSGPGNNECDHHSKKAKKAKKARASCSSAKKAKGSHARASRHAKAKKACSAHKAKKARKAQRH